MDAQFGHLLVSFGPAEALHSAHWVSVELVSIVWRVLSAFVGALSLKVDAIPFLGRFHTHMAFASLRWDNTLVHTTAQAWVSKLELHMSLRGCLIREEQQTACLAGVSLHKNEMGLVNGGQGYIPACAQMKMYVYCVNSTEWLLYASIIDDTMSVLTVSKLAAKHTNYASYVNAYGIFATA